MAVLLPGRQEGCVDAKKGGANPSVLGQLQIPSDAQDSESVFLHYAFQTRCICLQAGTLLQTLCNAPTDPIANSHVRYHGIDPTSTGENTCVRHV